MSKDLEKTQSDESNGGDSLKQDRMMKWFEYSHLPPHLQDTSRQFHNLAVHINTYIASGPERTVALRKLLEAKDAAVRATLHAGG